MIIRDNLLQRGVFVLSLDTELAWGSAHYGKVDERNICVEFMVDLLTYPDEEKTDQSLMTTTFTYFKNQKADLISTYAMQHESATTNNFQRLLRSLGFMPSRSITYVLHAHQVEPAC